MPWLGRWLSCDPIGLQAGTNLFAYVKNDPINFFDPRGTMEQTSGTPKEPLLDGNTRGNNSSQSSGIFGRLFTSSQNRVEAVSNNVNQMAAQANQAVNGVVNQVNQGVNAVAIELHREIEMRDRSQGSQEPGNNQKPRINQEIQRSQEPPHNQEAQVNQLQEQRGEVPPPNAEVRPNNIMINNMAGGIININGGFNGGQGQAINIINRGGIININGAGQEGPENIANPNAVAPVNPEEAGEYVPSNFKVFERYTNGSLSL